MRPASCVAILLVVAACGDDDGGVDAGPDAAVAASEDAAVPDADAATADGPPAPADAARLDAASSPLDAAPDGAPVDLPTTALYPHAGRNWNDYVRADGADRLHASDTPCDPDDGPGRDACVHGGELRAFAVPGRSTCAGLTASDSLGALSWTCLADGGAARMVSTGLQPAVRLGDLLDATGAWRPMSLVVLDGDTEVMTTPAEPWWENPVVRLDGPPAGAPAAGTIYVIAGDVAADVALDADRLGLVVFAGALLSSGGGAAVVSVTGDFAWIEGAIDAAGAARGLSADGASFAVLAGVEVAGAAETAVALHASPRALLRELLLSDSGALLALDGSPGADATTILAFGATSGDGVRVDDSAGSALSDVDVEDTAGAGVHVLVSSGVQIAGVTTAAAGGAGLFIDRCDGAVVAGAELGGSGLAGLRIEGGGNGTFTGVTATGSGASGLELENSSGNTLRALAVADNAGHGAYVTGDSRRNLVVGLVAAANGRKGLYVAGAADNTFADVTVAGHPEEGVLLSAAPSSRLLDVTAVGNDAGVSVDASPGGTLIAVTAANSRFLGLRLGASSSASYLANAIAANSGDVGAYFVSAGANDVRNLVAADGGSQGVSMTGDNAVHFGGVLRLGNNADGDCQIAPTSSGLDESCAPTAGSDAVVTLGATTAASFVGALAADDPVNQSDLAGAQARGSITDWTGFARPRRAWGRDGAYPGAASRGDCAGAETCRIRDWALAAADAIARAVSPAALDGDDVVVHAWSLSPAPASQADCDAAVPGSRFAAGGCATRFLRDAAELMDDGAGNDDTLCESGEACLVLRNAGAYQGHGDLVAAPFADGVITGVTLYEPAANGY